MFLVQWKFKQKYKKCIPIRSYKTKEEPFMDVKLVHEHVSAPTLLDRLFLNFNLKNFTKTSYIIPISARFYHIYQ
jgi:hypothetical protein